MTGVEIRQGKTYLGDVPALDRRETVCAGDSVQRSVAEDLDAVCGVELTRVQPADTM